MKKHLSPYYPGIILFLLSLVITFYTYQDYGTAWDEPPEVYLGQLTYNYISKGDKTLLTTFDKDHGSAFEVLLNLFERNIPSHTDRDVMLMRHFVSHIFFLLCALCFYILCLRLFKNKWMAALGFLIILFTPRLYAHSFFNGKDIPFMAMFMASFMVGQIAFEKNKLPWYALLGIVCAYTTDIRIMGILLFAGFAFFLLIDFIFAIVKKTRPILAIGRLVTFTISYFLFVYVFWPILWPAPVKNFKEEFLSFSHFDKWNGSVLLAGKVYRGDDLPWTYFPIWFSITVPELWLLSGIGGAVLLIVLFVKKPLRHLENRNERNFLLYLACFILPVISIIFLHSIIYDGWRHLYFVYPAFVLLSLFLINKIIAVKPRLKTVVIVACMIQLLFDGYFMVKYHPFEAVYFNRLVSHKKEYLRKNFEMEYWGCSYLQGYDSILAHDHSPVIKVFNSQQPAMNNYHFLPAWAQQHIVMTDNMAEADYYITNFRGHPSDYDFPIILSNITVESSSILRVYKLHK